MAVPGGGLVRAEFDQVPVQHEQAALIGIAGVLGDNIGGERDVLAGVRRGVPGGTGEVDLGDEVGRVGGFEIGPVDADGGILVPVPDPVPRADGLPVQRPASAPFLRPRRAPPAQAAP